MSYEAEQDMQDGTGEENADDLTLALAGGETSFVSEHKQPVSKGTMVVAGLLIACGAVTYFMYIRTGPAEAMARPDEAKDQQVINEVINGSGKADEWKKLIVNTEKVVQQFKKAENVVQVPIASNPFSKKSPVDDADMANRRKLEAAERLKTAAAEAVNDLRLQTIIHRDPKKATCMINNMMYRKGQRITVGGDTKVVFTVDEVRPDAVTVSVPIPGSEPLTFELKMKH